MILESNCQAKVVVHAIHGMDLLRLLLGRVWPEGSRKMGRNRVSRGVHARIKCPCDYVIGCAQGEAWAVWAAIDNG